MSEAEFNKIFSKRLNYYLNEYQMTQLDLSKKLGVGTTSVSNWCRGLKSPRMDKIDAMCKIFHCRRSDLMEDRANESEATYYTNQETAQVAQEIFENKNLRVLFDAARDASPDDLRTTYDMLMALKRKERGDSDEGC